MGAAHTAPPRPAFLKQKDVPQHPFAGVRRAVRDAYLSATERGWFGLVPLETHVVVCGYPRSGSTLLQLMLETSIGRALAFGRERSGLGVARSIWPGRHRMVLSKRPNDVFWIDEIRDYYAERTTKVRFVLTVRDPRAVLTSVFSGQTDYYVPFDRWRAVADHIEYQRQFPDVSVVEYRDLVERPEDVRQHLAAFIGWDIQRFDNFHAAVPETFNTRALSGVRPLDRSAFDKWRQPSHRPRIRQALLELPDLPQRLIDLGYEKDTAWTRDYR